MVPSSNTLIFEYKAFAGGLRLGQLRGLQNNENLEKWLLSWRGGQLAAGLLAAGQLPIAVANCSWPVGGWPIGDWPTGGQAIGGWAVGA